MLTYEPNYHSLNFHLPSNPWTYDNLLKIYNLPCLGQGLGKYSQGMSEPIKPSLKFDKTGVGHDPAKEFTDTWWSDAYKQAADNVVIGHDQVCGTNK